MRHRFAVFNWLQASFRMAQLVAHHAARSGPAIRAQLSTGEVVATVSNDAMRAGGAFDITARLSGAVVAYIVVALHPALGVVVLGVIVLVGVPVLVTAARRRDQAAAGAPARAARGGRQADRARRRHRRRLARAARHRRRAGVLRPLPRAIAGGAAAPAFASRCRNRRSTRPRCSSRASSSSSSPGSARASRSKGRSTTGELVAFYGYAAFLVIPLRTAAEAVDKITRSLVGARRMLNVLAVERARRRSGETRRRAARRRAARRSAVAARRRPGRARLPRLLDPRRDAARSPTGSGGSATRTASCSATFASRTCRVETVRRRIVVSEADPVLFAGTLRHELDPWGRAEGHDGADLGGDRDRERRGRARGAARRARRAGRGARPLVLGRPAAAARAGARAALGRRAARARRADERRRRAHRGADRRRGCATRAPGKTTVIVTTSPLVLDRADRVVLFEDGRAVAEGTHRELLHASPRYRYDRDARGRTREQPAADRRRAPSCASRRGLLARRHRRGLDRRHLPARGRGRGRTGRAAAARPARAVGAGRDDAPATSTSSSRSWPACLVVQTIAHLVRAARVVRALREDVRRAARGLHAPRARAAALDRRARRHRRPRLAHDRRRRRADADDPLRDPRDADRRRHGAADGRRRRLGEPARRAARASRACRCSSPARAGTWRAPRPATSGSAPPTRR